MAFYTLEDLSVTDAAPGIRRRSVYLDQLMLTFFELDEGACF